MPEPRADPLAAIRALRAQITAGRWFAEKARDNWTVCVMLPDTHDGPLWLADLGVYNGQQDAEFIAAAPGIVDTLLDAVDALRALLGELTEDDFVAVRGEPGRARDLASYYCHYCTATADKPADFPHRPTCPFARARALLAAIAPAPPTGGSDAGAT